MSLSTYQEILSRICTEEEFRTKFFANRESTLIDFDLHEKDKNRLLQIAEKQINFFAISLIRKRWGAVKSILFLSAEEGKLLWEHFHQYALNTAIHGRVSKHEFDALEFCVYLIKNKAIKENGALVKKIRRNKSMIKRYLVFEYSSNPTNRLIPSVLKRIPKMD